jgi:DNA-binding response OmpR family regulator
VLLAGLSERVCDSVVRALPADCAIVILPPERMASLTAAALGTSTEAEASNTAPAACGGLRINPLTHEAWYQGSALRLSEREFKVIALLMCGAEGEAHSFGELVQVTTGSVDRSSHASDRNLVHQLIKRIRGKLRSVRADVDLESVPGFGFRLRRRLAVMANADSNFSPPPTGHELSDPPTLSSVAE